MQRPIASHWTIAIFFLVLVIPSFWIQTGLDMYPINDGWVSAGQKSDFSWSNLLFTQKRELRKLPYLISQALEKDGFIILNCILIAIDIGAALCLYAVFFFLLERRVPDALLATALALLFPNDPTMFWLGAFGVNISYLLLLGATALTCAGIGRRRHGLFLLGLLLLFLGVRTYPGFVALPLFLTAYLSVRDQAARSDGRWWRYPAAQALVVALALAPTVWGALKGHGREASVASFDPGLVLEGYRRMASNLVYGWLDEVFVLPRVHAGYAIFYSLLVAGAVLALRRTPPSRDGERAAVVDLPSHWRGGLFLLAMLGVVVFGYLPYAVSEVRFDDGRALMASRIGAIALVVMALGSAARRVAWRPLAAILLAGASVLVALFALNRISLFGARLEESQHQRVFLADLAAAVPCPPDDTLMVFHTDRDTFRGSPMLVNRIFAPIQVLYRNRRIDAVTLNPSLLQRFGQLKDGRLQFRDTVISGRNLALFRYGFQEGLRPVESLQLRVGSDRVPWTLAAASLPEVECEITPLMKALLRDRERYLQALRLTR